MFTPCDYLIEVKGEIIEKIINFLIPATNLLDIRIGLI
jgi:hypothetical protein